MQFTKKGASIQCNQASLIRMLESQWYICPIKFLSISLAQQQKSVASMFLHLYFISGSVN